MNTMNFHTLRFVRHGSGLGRWIKLASPNYYCAEELCDMWLLLLYRLCLHALKTSAFHLQIACKGIHSQQITSETHNFVIWWRYEDLSPCLKTILNHPPNSMKIELGTCILGSWAPMVCLSPLDHKIMVMQGQRRRWYHSAPFHDQILYLSSHIIAKYTVFLSVCRVDMDNANITSPWLICVN